MMPLLGTGLLGLLRHPKQAHAATVAAKLAARTVDEVIIRHVATLWSNARKVGIPTAKEQVDGDVVLAAQALTTGVTVATTNCRHMARFVTVEDWSST